ncbi:MAG: YbjN domain-containing protein [Clostridiales bacterium]|nr:YbjN domain-containing protein [Clostridiales bacterium]
MADEKQLKKAQTVYASLCGMLDEKSWHYEQHKEDLVITFTARGDDIPMQFIIYIDADRELVRLMSPIPISFGEDKRVEGALATSRVNYALADGSFDYDFKEGKVMFRMTSSYRDSLISMELMKYMVGCALYTVDEYNDKFLMIAKGMMSVDDLFSK